MHSHCPVIYSSFCILPYTVGGRTDVQKTANNIVFTPARKSAFVNITIVKDDVLEFDELFIMVFEFSPEITNKWNVRKGTPATTYVWIRDDDCEL